MAEKIRKAYTRRIQPHPCEHCGQETQRPRFCTVKCSQVARDRRNGVQPRKICPSRTCVVCSEEFVRPNRGDRDVGLCCSRECGFTLIRWRGEQTRKFTEAKKQFARWARQARQQPKAVRDTRKRCRDCGGVVGKAQQRCVECRAIAAARNKAAARLRQKTSPSYLAYRRADKSRRKALARGKVAGSERFDPLEVLARDGWHCHICGVATPKRLRGSYDDRAPELDHIIPLAAGGQHTRQNTACACRRCNISKADKPLGQLRLVA